MSTWSNRAEVYGVEVYGVTTPPAHLRMIDAELQKIEGAQVRINESFRVGVVEFQFFNDSTTLPPLSVVTSSATLSWLDGTERKGGPEWGAVANLIRTTMKNAETKMQTQMVDLTKVAKVVDRRKVTRPSDDRVEHVCVGIRDLTGQMASMLSGHVVHDDTMVNGVAKRYSALAAEMQELRQRLTEAEGMFEIAQAQVIALMDGA